MTTNTPTPDRASLSSQGYETWKGTLHKLALYKLPALYLIIIFLAAYFWGTMGIIGVLATTTVLAAFGYLFKEL